MNETHEEHVRALIEEQLGEFRHFAGLPATEIEAMAMRITRAIEAFLHDRCSMCGVDHRSAA